MVAVALALGASLAWGASDFLAGLKHGRLAVVLVLLVSQATGLVLVGSPPSRRASRCPAATPRCSRPVAGIAELVGFAALYRALAIGSMSVVAPISATAALLPVVVGLATGESPGMWQAIGIVLALGGATLASLERGAGRQPAGAPRPASASRFVAALAFGTFFVGMDLAADDGALWAVAVSRAAAVGALLAVVVAMRSPLKIEREQLPALAAVGALDIAANTMFTFALTVGMASIVAVLGSLYPVATVALAVVILRERVTGSQQSGVVAALAGIGLVSLA